MNESKEEMTLCAEHVEHMLWCQSLAMPCLVEQLADLRFFIEMLGAVLAGVQFNLPHLP